MKETIESVYAVGLDIGSSKVCAVAGRQDHNGKISILDFAEAGYNPDYESMSRGIAKNKENLSKTVNAVLQELSDKTNLEIALVNCSFSNEFIALKALRNEITNDGNKFSVKNAELEELVKGAKSQLLRDSQNDILHCIPTDFFIDELKIGKYPKGATGNKLSCNFNAVINPKRRIEDFMQFTDDFGCEWVEGRKEKHFKVIIDQLVYSGHADSLACLSIEDKQAGVLLINLGAQLTEISIYKDFGLRYTHVIGVGAETIVHDISQAFNISEKEAERLMLVSGEKRSKNVEINEVLEVEGKNGLPTRQFLQKSVSLVMESRVREIAGMVASIVIESGYARMLGNGIMLTGAATRMGLIRQIFERTFEPLAVRIANATQNIEINTKLELSNPKYSTAIGTMLSSFKPLDERLPLTRVLKEKRRLQIGFLSNNPLVNKLREMFDEPDLRRTYGE